MSAGRVREPLSRGRGLARWARRVAAAGLVALATVGGAGDMAAQTPPAKSSSEGDLTTAEAEALQLARDDKFISARTKAEAILKDDPTSIVAHFVMGSALREAEGALARSLAHLKRARELYEARYPGGVGEGRPWRVYADTLFGIAITSQLMEDFEGSLRAFDDYDDRFEPKLLSQRVWPLMKLGRYAEARDWAKRAIDSGSPSQKMRAMNGLCAVEAEEKKRVASYEACLAIYKYAKDRAAASKETDPARVPQIVVYANNAHLGALSVLKYDEAEQLAIDGSKSREETSANPWLRLARLYVDEGRAAEAVSAAKALQAWRVQQPPSTREQFRAEDESTVAMLLLAAGEAEAALRLADRVLDRPDRRAMISTNPEQTAGANALLRRAIVRLGAELAAERASSAGWKDAPVHRAEALRLSALAWPDAQRVVGALLDEPRLLATLRVYLAGGIEHVPTWLLGDLVEVLGPGVFLVALDEVRRTENEIAALGAFYDGLEAEARLAQGDEGMALLLAKKALESLPKAEVLFKARVAAVGAAAAQRAGDTPTAIGLFEQAMQADPGVIRRLGLELPVTFVVDLNSELASEAAKLLRRSPRLTEEKGGFTLQVGDAGGGLSVCLRTPLGAELGCGRVPIVVAPPAPPSAPAPFAAAAPAGTAPPAKADPPPPKPAPERAAEAFHKTVFALKMNLSESDLRSLDGGTTATRDAARERMRDLIEDTPGAEKPAPEER